MVGFYDEIKGKSDVELIELLKDAYGVYKGKMIEMELHRRFSERINESIETFVPRTNELIELLDKNIAEGLTQIMTYMEEQQ